MKLLLTSILLFVASLGQSQDDGSFFLYNNDWEEVKDPKKATYFMQLVKVNDTTFNCNYYHFTGPLIRVECYKDADLAVPHGRFSWYNWAGWLDSTGIVHNGKKHDYWHYMRQDSSKVVIIEKYQNGKFIYRSDYQNKRTTYADGTVEPHKEPGPKEKKDTGAVSVQVEAAFDGGLNSWRKYLMKTLKTPKRFIDLSGNYRKAIVWVAFTVDTTGKVEDIYLARSVEWSVDMEALRVIRKSPDWVPATQNGKAVRYNQRQPIVFVVDSE